MVNMVKCYAANSELVEQVAFFAFILGNGSLLPQNSINHDIEYDYEECIMEDPRVLVEVFCVYVNNYVNSADPSIAEQRAAQWLAHQCLPEYTIDPPIEPWELLESQGKGDVFDAIKAFGRAIAFGDLPGEYIEGIDYSEYLSVGGSFLEEVIKVFLNNLLVNEDGIVINYREALKRATQYIRYYIDKSYAVNPPIAGWEVGEYDRPDTLQ